MSTKVNPRSSSGQTEPSLQLKCGPLHRSHLPTLSQGRTAASEGSIALAGRVCFAGVISDQQLLTCGFEKSCQSGGPSSSRYMQRRSPIIGGTVHVGITLNPPAKRELAEGSSPLSSSISPLYLRLYHSPNCYTGLALSLKKSPVRELGWSRGCGKWPL